jgi:hypothetical protein
MSFPVRIFGHQGIVPLKVVEDTQYRADSVFQLKQPYLWKQQLTADTGAAVSSTANTDLGGHTLDATTILRIEVPDGKTIAYEVNPPGRAVVATTASPRLSGKDQIQFGVNWIISVIDVTGVA